MHPEGDMHGLKETVEMGTAKSTTHQKFSATSPAGFQR